MSIVLAHHSSSVPPNPILWLKADKGIHLSGNTVYQWNDQSGNGYDFIQLSVANQPLLVNNFLNGKPVIRFDGINDYMKIGSVLVSGWVEYTSFIVVKTFGSLGQTIGTTYPSEDYILNYYDASNSFWQGFGGGAIYSYTGTVDFINFNIVTQRFYGAGSSNTDKMKLFLNGVNKSLTYHNIYGASTTTNQTDFYIGNDPNYTSYLMGDIAEILIYNSALADSNRQYIENYLKIKYAIV